MNLPCISVRTFSDDWLILDQILHNNFYALNKFKKEDVVIDLGAHIGVFTFCCFAASAGKIYSFEPFIENYRLLLKNTESLLSTDKIVTHQLGISLENCNLNFNYPEQENRFYVFSNISTENLDKNKKYLCPCISLNNILSSYVLENEVELLKINIGSREIDILLSCPLLPLKVKNVCGVTSSTDEEIIKFQDKMKILGYKDCFTKKINKDNDYYIFFFSKEKLENRFSLKV